MNLRWTSSYVKSEPGKFAGLRLRRCPGPHDLANADVTETETSVWYTYRCPCQCQLGVSKKVIADMEAFYR